MAPNLSSFLKKLTANQRLIIAYSGGMDSHVLLHLIYSFKQQYQIDCIAIHVNHQLNIKSNEWEQHCKKTCEQLNIPFQCITVDINPQPQDSLEALARQHRYTVLQNQMQVNDILFTAHHQDDQAETLLLQLMRGAGPKGLAAMPVMRPFGLGQHHRPLLSYSQSEIHDYAKKHQLDWIEDDSNLNTQLDRNFMRHNIIPLLKQRWPSIANNLSRSAAHCATASLTMLDLAEHDATIDQMTLSIAPLQTLPQYRRLNVLRHWILKQNCLLPDTKQLNEIDQILFCKHDRQPLIKIKGYEIRRFNNKLYLVLPLPPHNPSIIIPWNGCEDLILPNNIGTLHADKIKVLLPERTKANSLSVRFRQGGETIKISANKQTKSLKTLFQERKIPPWIRNRIPLIFSQQQLLLVVWPETS